MKKLSFLFVVMALAMFAVVFAASAQEAELPAIDEAEAAPYLGTWYMAKMCSGSDCMDIAGMGLSVPFTFNKDNTAVMEGEDGDNVISWYMEEGTAYLIGAEEGKEPEKVALTLDKDGNLVLGDDESSVVYVREIAPAIGSGAIKADAVLEDFAGEWVLNGMLAEGSIISASLFGMTGKLTVGESTMSIVLFDESTEEIPYELKDGKLYAAVTEKDAKGNEITTNFVFEYHEDNCIHMYEAENQADSTMIFVREADQTTGPSLFEGLSELSNAEGEGAANTEMSEAELESLFAELSSQLEAEGGAGEGFDLSGLLQNIDLQGIMQNENVQEILNSPELQGVISKLQDENGEFNLDGLMNDLGGMFGGTGENGESGLNLDGLMQGLGGLFGSEAGN